VPKAIAALLQAVALLESPGEPRGQFYSDVLSHGSGCGNPASEGQGRDQPATPAAHGDLGGQVALGRESAGRSATKNRRRSERLARTEYRRVWVSGPRVGSVRPHLLGRSSLGRCRTNRERGARVIRG
jgi:hypothetical protein